MTEPDGNTPGPEGPEASAQQDDLPASPSRLRRFWSHPLGRFGVVGLVALVLFSFVGPLVYRASPYSLHIAQALQPPSARFPQGTNNLGRNMLARLMLGGQTSIEVGFAAAVAGMVIGIAYGMIAGLAGGALDALMMRVVDLLRSVPALFLLLFLDAVVRPTAILLVVLIAFVSWHGVSRIMRGEVLALKGHLYVEAAVAAGASRARIMVRHLLPNAMGTLLVATTFHVADAILAVAGLSFLGLGLPPPVPNWGGMLADAMAYLPQNAWWLAYPPGLAILVIILCINFVGDAMRFAFDLQLRRGR